jgi:hypothetical protein
MRNNKKEQKGNNKRKQQKGINEMGLKAPFAIAKHISQAIAKRLRVGFE